MACRRAGRSSYLRSSRTKTRMKPRVFVREESTAAGLGRPGAGRVVTAGKNERCARRSLRPIAYLRSPPSALSLERRQIRRNIRSILLGDAQVRHRVLRPDRLRRAEPLDHRIAGVRQHAGDQRPRADACEWRPDRSVAADDARNGVTGHARVLMDRRLATSGVRYASGPAEAGSRGARCVAAAVSARADSLRATTWAGRAGTRRSPRSRRRPCETPTPACRSS